MNDFIFFYNGIYSQWYPSKIKIIGVEYNCCEQFMMAQKALFFKDGESYDQIMATNNPSDQKALGRSVKNFNSESWAKVCRNIVYQGNLAKFMQNPNLRKQLGETGNKEIVEASPTDKIWGCGLVESDPRILDKANWTGLNWLGIEIMRVRDELFPTTKK